MVARLVRSACTRTATPSAVPDRLSGSVRSRFVLVTELRGLPVLSLRRAYKLARVRDVYLDCSYGYVAALSIGDAATKKPGLLPRNAIAHVGRGAIVLAGHDDQPLESYLEKGARLVDVQTLMGLQVVTDHGTWIGRIRAATMDPHTLAIINYEVAPGPWPRRAPGREVPTIDAKRIIHASREALIIAEDPAAVSRPPRGPWIEPDPFVTPAATPDATVARDGAQLTTR